MLEKLFGSRGRIKLLRILLNHPEESFSSQTLARKTRLSPQMLRAFLKDLLALELLKEQRGTSLVSINAASFIYPELRALFLKSDLLFERDLVSRLTRIGNVLYLAITGKLLGAPAVPVDFFIVGRINRRRLRQLMKSFERELGREINYAVMSRQEFAFRRSLTDRFLYSILEGRKIVAVNRLKI